MRTKTLVRKIVDELFTVCEGTPHEARGDRLAVMKTKGLNEKHLGGRNKASVTEVLMRHLSGRNNDI